MKAKSTQEQYVGDIFETFVGLLLSKLYPDYTFEHTKYKHDGGKDFYAVFSDEKIWAEAKCCSRHLELSRIAGTFIMAEIFKINKVIVFSKSKLTKGTLTNLARYAAMNMLTLIVYQDNDIVELVKSFGDFTTEEKIAKISKTDSQFNINNLNCTIATLIKKIKAIKKKEKEGNSHINSLLLACAYKKYEEYLNSDKIPKKKRDAKLIDNLFYQQGFNANPVPLEKEIKAFETFSSDIILRNENLNNKKRVDISYVESTKSYNSITNSNYSVQLEPCQCVCVKFYFKALNDSANFRLPKPKILADEKKIAVSVNKNYSSPISCWCIGEVPYIGKDSEKLSQCCINLGATARQFAMVCVYGKSGTGKSRFLTELYYARQKSGNKCYFIKGENNRNSLYEFLRSLINGIYSFNFNRDGTIVFPESIKNAFKVDKNFKSFEFIDSILKCENQNDIDTVSARNWLGSVLKNGNVTILVDNTQFVHKDVLSFLRQVCNDLQLCHCNSEIVFAFNSDYMMSTSLAYHFLNDLKNTLPEDYKYEIEGFDQNDAIKYLQYSLDPDKLREDLEPLCKDVISRLGCNPLYLKQIVLYLFQKNIIGFYDNTICILNFELLQTELNGLPPETHSLINLRYTTLLKQNSDTKDRIKDLFWSVLIFDKFPKIFTRCIDGLPLGLLKTCTELGFLKSDGETVTFEHQLIAKSILISIQEDAYTAHPVITKIGLSEATKNNFIKELKADRYSTVKFALEYSMRLCNAKKFSEYTKSINLKHITDVFIPYIVYAVEVCVYDYNATLPARIKIDALYRLITGCQDKLGVQTTKMLFEAIIEFQADNFSLNSECDEKFIELLKFYIHELPPREKSDFILRVKKIGITLLTLNKRNVDDFQVWILWALGKSHMHIHDFDTAFLYLNQGAELAEKTDNFHRLAEINVQLGYLSAYKMQKSETAKYWKTASENFNRTGIYDEILSLVYKGNVLLLNNDVEHTQEIISKLLVYYENKDSYAFLKSVINDFICNKLILQSVKNDRFDDNLHRNIKTQLNKFRSQTITYNLRAYMLALYKTLTYLKYVIENFSDIRVKGEVEKDYALAKLMSIELLSNYDENVNDFYYFYPIFKDVDTLFNSDEYFLRELNNRSLIQSDRMGTANLNLELPVVFGVLSDEKHKVNLFHYSYTW